MSRTRIIDSVILIALLIGVSTFPTNYFVKDVFWYYVIEALLMLVVLLFLLFYEKRNLEVVPYKKRFNLSLGIIVLIVVSTIGISYDQNIEEVFELITFLLNTLLFSNTVVFVLSEIAFTIYGL